MIPAETMEENRQTALKVALAGLLHDMGKFAQGNMEVTRQYINDNADQYQPFNKKSARHSHIHVIHTAAFLEQYADRLPVQFNQSWGKGDSLINLAAGHHKPETPYQWLIARADRISSGLDRNRFEEGEKISFKNFKKTRLLPILERLDPDQRDRGAITGKDFKYRYPLLPLSAGSIFPVQAEAKSIQADPEEEYGSLFAEFIKQLASLEDKNGDIELWANHFNSLLLTCTAMIPAARVGDVVHDVSLYDHSRTTAAFATALYRYHNDTDTMAEKSINDDDLEKFLLITGDFYGIQDFIFSGGGETGKFRSKLLRGRSFSVSMFSELATDMLCRRLGLTFLSTIFNAAGKFTIIAANTEKSRDIVEDVKNTINDWLFSVSYGQAAMGIAVTPCRQSDFYSGLYGKLHDRHVQDIQAVKKQRLDFSRYGGVAKDYFDSFDNSLDRPICGLCGKRAAEAEASRDYKVLKSKVSACAVCRDHVMLGTGLVREKIIAIIDNQTVKGAGDEGIGMLRPVFDRYQLVFASNLGKLDGKHPIIKKYQFRVGTGGNTLSTVTMQPLNGYVPLYTEADEHDDRLLASRRDEDKTLEMIDQIRAGDPKSFSHIAVAAKNDDQNQNQNKNKNKKSFTGTEAIGVLKADVDNLGLLMGCGLPEEWFSISRMATLSRQLDSFFSVYLPDLLAGEEKFKDVYTVFAGGDDLFLIGPWNRMAYLAKYIRTRFAEFVAGNKKITFSAGITVHKPHVPVNKMAAAAEEALEQAKEREGKNSITMFEQSVNWDEFHALLENRDAMQSWLDEKKYISASMMYRFNHLITLAQRMKIAMAGNRVCLDDLDAMKWRAMFSYSLQRNLDSSLKDESRQRALAEVGVMAGWLDKYGGAMRIPLWHLLYDRR